MMSLLDEDIIIRVNHDPASSSSFKDLFDQHCMKSMGLHYDDDDDDDLLCMGFPRVPRTLPYACCFEDSPC